MQRGDGRMKRTLPYLRTIIANPLSWVAVAVVLVLEFRMAVWFQPSPAVMALAIGTGVILLALWPILLIRSPDFERLHAQSRHATSLEAYVKRLQGCFPSFKSPRRIAGPWPSALSASLVPRALVRKSKQL